jgi:hypothetical protein
MSLLGSLDEHCCALLGEDDRGAYVFGSFDGLSQEPHRRDLACSCGRAKSARLAKRAPHHSCRHNQVRLG